MIYKIIIFVVLNNQMVVAEDSYFNSMYESMKQAQETLKEVAINVNQGLKTLAQTMKFVENFIDSTIDEDCIYTCPRGKIMIPNPDHKPTSNGCGSFGVFYDREDLSRPEMADCCDEHDICYDLCGSEKEDCDRKFKRCLYNSCNVNEDSMDILTFKKCQGGAKLLYTATMALGCTSFREAQSKACICQPINSNNYKREKYYEKQEL
ncbi:unnamed protein product [Meganyctiphanes norvegica]|uniref:Phospholipase A(2) n=1 Tax=Meganyctiphanes norvegica TaxID=48144 RepID=A0AAV2SIQ4_MEGNR